MEKDNDEGVGGCFDEKREERNREKTGLPGLDIECYARLLPPLSG